VTKRRIAAPPWRGNLTPKKVTPPGSPLGYAVGLMARDSKNARLASVTPLIKSFVPELDWNTAQNTAGGPITASAISYLQGEATFAQTHNFKMRLRIFSGVYAPNFAKSVGGFTPLDWYVPNQNTGVVSSAGTVGPWWRADYQALYIDFLSKLADVLEPLLPYYAEVTQSGLMTLYAEPLVHSWDYQDPAVIVARGYTIDNELAAFAQVNQAHVDIFSSMGLASSLSLNPFNMFDPTPSNGKHWNASDSTTYYMLDEFCNRLGRFAVIANNSLANPIGARGIRYENMYNYMIARRARVTPFPVGMMFQTAAMARMFDNLLGATPLLTAQMAQGWGALSVEMPSGWSIDQSKTSSSGVTTTIPGVTQAQADTLNAQLQATYDQLVGF
jgi:hypothetical protein